MPVPIASAEAMVFRCICLCVRASLAKEGGDAGWAIRGLRVNEVW
jgi:hypothetical protein